jgi:hypothetical protein
VGFQSADKIADYLGAFRQGLSEFGYIEGRNLAIEYPSLRCTSRPTAGPVLQNVSEERARTIIRLAEAQLVMEASRDWQTIDLSAGSVMRWFLDATNDPESAT